VLPLPSLTSSIKVPGLALLAQATEYLSKSALMPADPRVDEEPEEGELVEEDPSLQVSGMYRALLSSAGVAPVVVNGLQPSRVSATLSFFLFWVRTPEDVLSVSGGEGSALGGRLTLLPVRPATTRQRDPLLYASWSEL
jgi:hypothetical protein